MSSQDLVTTQHFPKFIAYTISSGRSLAFPMCFEMIQVTPGVYGSRPLSRGMPFLSVTKNDIRILLGAGLITEADTCVYQVNLEKCLQEWDRK